MMPLVRLTEIKQYPFCRRIEKTRKYGLWMYLISWSFCPQPAPKWKSLSRPLHKIEVPNSSVN